MFEFKENLFIDLCDSIFSTITLIDDKKQIHKGTLVDVQRVRTSKGVFVIKVIFRHGMFKTTISSAVDIKTGTSIKVMSSRCVLVEKKFNFTSSRK